ncbi:cold-shock protein [Zunongwangia sp.]|uniref:cold-shock protein n=1 Tax=Zunongwangia sp. TaxID=1965325 RepID=UPI003AA8EC02
MGDSFNKKETNKKKIRKRKLKEQRREERKTSNDKGKTLEDMMVYVDHNGNLTDTPPGEERKSVNLEDVQLGAARDEEEEERKEGVVLSFFTEKGYGFIKENSTGNNIFVHKKDLVDSIKETDKVSFFKKKSPKGARAVQVEKI